MIQEVTSGPVTQFKMSRSLFGQNLRFTAAYFIDGLLIDTGFDHVAHEFFECLSQKNVQQIIHTHAHEDHVGSNYLFQERCGLKAKAHPGAIELIRNPPKKLKTYRRVIWGIPKAADVEPINNEIFTDKYKFKTIHVPGHSKDHVGFYEPNEGWFFGGDLFLGIKVKVLRYDEQVYELMASLKEVMQLPMSRYFCGTGKILESPGERLSMKLQFFEEVQAQVLELHYQGWKIKRIRNHILGREGTIFYISQGEFSKLNLVKGIIDQRS
jgi:glyoxylase-like metal-dependent hydrolase (beta-lactamase superfamily II)